MKYVLRGKDNSGNVFYYTGRANENWISNNLKEAFDYGNYEPAEHRANLMNEYTPLHGIHFRVEEVAAPIER